jgi:hypothetical protein
VRRCVAHASVKNLDGNAARSRQQARRSSHVALCPATEARAVRDRRIPGRYADTPPASIVKSTSKKSALDARTRGSRMPRITRPVARCVTSPPSSTGDCNLPACLPGAEHPISPVQRVSSGEAFRLQATLVLVSSGCSVDQTLSFYPSQCSKSANEIFPLG